jgi:hypothetical protein
VFQAALFLSQSGEISLKKTIDLVSHFREQFLISTIAGFEKGTNNSLTEFCKIN